MTALKNKTFVSEERSVVWWKSKGSNLFSFSASLLDFNSITEIITTTSMVKTRSGGEKEFPPVMKKAGVGNIRLRRSVANGCLPKGFSKRNRLRREEGVKAMRDVRESVQWTEILRNNLEFLAAHPAGPRVLHLLRFAMQYITLLEHQIHQLQ